MSVIKTIDLVGVSTESWRDAAAQALAEAGKTLRGIEGMDVLETISWVPVKRSVRARGTLSGRFLRQRRVARSTPSRSPDGIVPVPICSH